MNILKNFFYYRPFSVKHDTELLLPLLAPNGFFVWHDYANCGYFDGKNGVPEYLGELSAKLPIAHIMGSDIAIYSPAWAGEQKQRYLKAIQSNVNPSQVNVWETTSLRG